jgi:hypothetical protein
VAVMKAGAVKGLAHENFPSFLRQRENALILDAWGRGEQRQAKQHGLHEIDGTVFSPKEQQVTEEYKQLSKLSPTPLGGLIVTSLGQTLYVDGVRRAGATDNMEVWDTWQANGWDAKQIPLHRAAIGMGLSFSTVRPDRDPLTGDRMAKMSAFSPKRMAAWYDDPNDEWPTFAMQADKVVTRDGFLGTWTVTLIDEEAAYYLSCENDGYDLDDWTFISYQTHGMPVPPVVRYANRLDLDGRATGEIEHILPMLARVDQNTFDRLIVQRFGAWKVRYIAGMAKPDSTTDKVAEALRLKIEDLLVSTDKDTKFGTLDASDLKPFLEADDHDLRMIAAISQTPPHHLLGLSSNLQAEALTAATEGLMRKSSDFRMLNGEAHEQNFRLVAIANDNKEEARATDMQVRWRDTQSQSLIQVANALSLVATGLKVPVEMLWEKLPGWTDGDTERAKALVEDGSFEKLLGALESEVAANAAKDMATAVPPEPKSTGGSDNAPKGKK